MQNPLIALYAIDSSGDPCDGHLVGVTWKGRLVFLSHDGIYGVEAGRVSSVAQGTGDTVCWNILRTVQAMSHREKSRSLAYRSLRRLAPERRRRAGAAAAARLHRFHGELDEHPNHVRERIEARKHSALLAVFDKHLSGLTYPVGLWGWMVRK